MGAYDLITLAELKVFPGLSALPASEDTNLQGLITGASLAFERYWKKPGIQRSFTEKHTIKSILAGSRDADKIWLRKGPVTAVTSITDPAGNTIAATDYWIDEDEGCLCTSGAWQTPQDTNGFASYWTIVYTAGLWAAITNVPDDIKMACKMYVSELYKNPTQTVVSKTVGEVSIARAGRGAEEATSALPANIRNLISEFRRRDI